MRTFAELALALSLSSLVTLTGCETLPSAKGTPDLPPAPPVAKAPDTVPDATPVTSTNDVCPSADLRALEGQPCPKERASCGADPAAKSDKPANILVCVEGHWTRTEHAAP